MRTTITLSDDLFREAKALSGDRSLSDFVRRAVREHVERLKANRLAADLAEGYDAEADRSSLDAEWAAVEVEGL
jgi:predicted CopG family antitoxin